MAGQIQFFFLRDFSGAQRIRLGSELGGNDPTAWFVDGQLAASQGDWDRSLERLKHYAHIVAGGAGEAVDLYLQTFDRPDLALAVANDDAPALERLADVLAKNGGDSQTVAAARLRAGDLRMNSADRAD